MTEFEAIYDSLRGLLLPEYAAAGVENAFQEGSLCDTAYKEMLDAYERLLDRLGVKDEDEDVEIIISSLLRIQDHLAQRMFVLGKSVPTSRCSADLPGK